MARPSRVIPSVNKNIAIPQDLCARLELELYSELEGRIPFGAQAKFFEQLLREHFAHQDALKEELKIY